MVRDDVLAVTVLYDGEVDGGALLCIGELDELQHLMRQLHRRVAAELRRAAGMRGPALDLDVDGAGALAPDRDAVADPAAFEVERHVVLPGEILDQDTRAARAGLLVGV